LLERFPVLAESHPEFVAYHYSEAGIGEKALEYWRTAGLRAVEASANVEATGHLRAALKELNCIQRGLADPGQEVELQIALGTALTAARGYGSSEVADAYARAFALCENLGDAKRLFAALTGLHSYYQVRGPIHRAREVAERLLALAVGSHDESQLAQAHRRLGWSLFCGGDMSGGKSHLDNALELYDATRSSEHNIQYGAHPWIVGFVNSAWVEWVVGHPSIAADRSLAAIALARDLGRPLPLAYALCMSAAMHQCRGEPEAALEFASETVALARDNSMPYWIAWATVLQGWALASTGETSKGIQILEAGLNAYRDTGAELFRPYCLCLLAEALRLGGRPEDALNLLPEALSSADELDVHFYTAEIHRLRGDLLAETGADFERVAACYRKAASLAHSQSAGSFELRASSSLAGLLARLGRADEVDQIAEDLKRSLPDQIVASAPPSIRGRLQ
jgi:predicted ATPase